MVSIGEVIRKNREELDYSQEELCFGICSVSTLSKIENGTQVPTRGTFEALMQRMGLSTGVYPSFLNDKDKRSYELQHDFNEAYSIEDYDVAERILDEMDSLPKPDKVYEQFVLMSRALVRGKRGLSPEDEAKEFEKAIALSIKDFSPNKIRRSLLTKTEINLLNAYAIAQHRAGNTGLAIKSCMSLLPTSRTRFTIEGASRLSTQSYYSIYQLI